MMFFLFFLENWIWYFTQIVSSGDDLHEVSNPILQIFQMSSAEIFTQHPKSFRSLKLEILVLVKIKPNKRAKIALYRSPDYQTSFESIGLSVQKKKVNIEFQDGSHLGFPREWFKLPLIYKSPWYFQWSLESIGLLLQDKKGENRMAAILDFLSEWF